MKPTAIVTRLHCKMARELKFSSFTFFSLMKMVTFRRQLWQSMLHSSRVNPEEYSMKNQLLLENLIRLLLVSIIQKLAQKSFAVPQVCITLSSCKVIYCWTKKWVTYREARIFAGSKFCDLCDFSSNPQKNYRQHFPQKIYSRVNIL